MTSSALSMFMRLSIRDSSDSSESANSGESAVSSPSDKGAVGDRLSASSSEETSSSGTASTSMFISSGSASSGGIIGSSSSGSVIDAPHWEQLSESPPVKAPQTEQRKRVTESDESGSSSDEVVV